MIRAHLASFPPRADILMQTVASILPQVDRLCICLNGYDVIPPELGDQAKVEAWIPDTDLKDAGKFAFRPKPDDMVFTIDDDILYPPDYVSRTLAMLDQMDPAANVLGYQGNALVHKKRLGKEAWRNFLFRRALRDIVKVDILGTGTACQLGRIVPSLDQVVSAAGFVDLRHARLHTAAGRDLWVLPRQTDEIVNNMRADLWDSSLFQQVHRARPPAMMAEHRQLQTNRSALSGLKREQVIRRRANAARRQASRAAPTA